MRLRSLKENEKHLRKRSRHTKMNTFTFCMISSLDFDHGGGECHAQIPRVIFINRGPQKKLLELMESLRVAKISIERDRNSHPLHFSILDSS